MPAPAGSCWDVLLGVCPSKSGMPDTRACLALSGGCGSGPDGDLWLGGCQSPVQMVSVTGRGTACQGLVGSRVVSRGFYLGQESGKVSFFQGLNFL